MRSLLILILLMPIFAFAEEVKIFVDYRGSIKADKINIDSPAQRAWMTNQVKSNSAWFADSKHMGRLNLHSGAVAKSTLPVVLEHQVTKKAVLQNMFGKVSTYAKNPIVGRAGWVGLAASFAVPYIIDEFFLDEEKGVWVANDKYYFLVITYNYNGYSSYTVNSLEQLQENCKSWGTACTTQATFSASAASGKDLRLEYCKTLTRKHSDGKTYKGDRMNGNSCVVMIGGGLYSVPTPNGQYIATVRVNEQREMTYEDFERLTLPAADADPSPWVNYSRPSQNEAPPSFAFVGVTAQSGANVNTDPYTDPFDGKAKETKITINSDSKTVTLNHTLRPDLQGQTDVAPVPTPIPDNDTETKPETTPASTPVQCDKYPDTLGCEKMGDGSEAESIFSDIKIPEITNPAEFKLDNFLPDNGSCPAPKTYSTSHGSIMYSYEKHCDVARTLRPFLIAFASVTALYLIFFRKA